MKASVRKLLNLFKIFNLEYNFFACIPVKKGFLKFFVCLWSWNLYILIGWVMHYINTACLYLVEGTLNYIPDSIKNISTIGFISISRKGIIPKFLKYTCHDIQSMYEMRMNTDSLIAALCSRCRVGRKSRNMKIWFTQGKMNCSY